MGVIWDLHKLGYHILLKCTLYLQTLAVLKYLYSTIMKISLKSEVNHVLFLNDKAKCIQFSCIYSAATSIWRDVVLYLNGGGGGATCTGVSYRGLNVVDSGRLCRVFPIHLKAVAQASVKTGSEIISVKVSAYQHGRFHHKDNQEQ